MSGSSGVVSKDNRGACEGKLGRIRHSVSRRETRSEISIHRMVPEHQLVKSYLVGLTFGAYFTGCTAINPFTQAVILTSPITFICVTTEALFHISPITFVQQRMYLTLLSCIVQMHIFFALSLLFLSHQSLFPALAR